MNASLKLPSIVIGGTDFSKPILTVTGRDSVSIRAGTIVTVAGVEHLFEDETPVSIIDLVVGQDYGVRPGADGGPEAVPVGPSCLSDGVTFAGFHYAPGGNAAGRSGGDDVPAINPFSCWDIGFRPSCADPRGMAAMKISANRTIWVDIYKLCRDHLDHGTSHFGAEIADGDSLPQSPDGKGRTRSLDYPTAVAIYAHHGKQLLSYDEFRIAAFGVTEKTAARRDPKITGLDAPRTSFFGIMQATGNLWDWGHDGDLDEPRASIFGGSWWSGVLAGSRYASLGRWPEVSVEGLSARGRSDHLIPE